MVLCGRSFLILPSVSGEPAWRRTCSRGSSRQVTDPLRRQGYRRFQSMYVKQRRKMHCQRSAGSVKRASLDCVTRSHSLFLSSHLTTASIRMKNAAHADSLEIPCKFVFFRLSRDCSLIRPTVCNGLWCGILMKRDTGIFLLFSALAIGVSSGGMGDVTFFALIFTLGSIGNGVLKAYRIR